MIKDKNYKIIVIGLLVCLAAGLFLSARFLRAQINAATHPLGEVNQLSTGLDESAWNKIKHHFEH